MDEKDIKKIMKGTLYATDKGLNNEHLFFYKINGKRYCISVEDLD